MISTTLPDGFASGEQIEFRKDRLARSVKGVLFGIGLASGAPIGFYIASNDFSLSATWPPALSAGIAILYLVAVIGGSVALSRLMDEEERFRGYRAMAVPSALYLVVYPVWFLLWKGGFAIEPIHWLLFVGFWASLCGAAIFYRFR